MIDYKKMYLTLLPATEKAINELILAQRTCEEIYMQAGEEEPTNIKPEIIKFHKE